MRKFERIAKTIAGQIEKGDFSLSGLPSGRLLAEGLGVNRNTIKKALANLENKGIIHRRENGRYEIIPRLNGREKGLKIAFLTPPRYASGNLRIWYEELKKQTAKKGLFFRPFLFVHWDDVAISHVLANFDGVFIASLHSEPIPPNAVRQLQSNRGIVMINNNLDHDHVLSIDLFPGVFVRHVLDRLSQLGHRSISCLHIEPGESDILQDRINQWKYWSVLNGNDAPSIKANISPFNKADVFLSSQIKQGHFKDSTAVFCTTIHSASALIRACKNNGIDPERDIAICTIDDEGIGMHSTPSVSCFRKPNIQKMLHPIFTWIKAGGDIRDWSGPLLVEPSSLKFYKGETFHPPSAAIKSRVK